MAITTLASTRHELASASVHKCIRVVQAAARACNVACGVWWSSKKTKSMIVITSDAVKGFKMG